MIPNTEKHKAKSKGRKVKSDQRRRHYLAVKRKISALLRGITSKNHGDFYCLNYLHFFKTEKKIEFHKRICGNKDFCSVIMPEDTNISEFNQHPKSDKARFGIYADHECIIENIDECKNNSENLSTKIVSEHIPSGFSMSTISSCQSIESKHDVYWCKDCMIKSYELFRKQSIKMINFKIKNNDVINKRAARIILKCKNLLSL